MRRIPIRSAREFGRAHRLDQVVIFGWSRETGLRHVVTWGRSANDCAAAADLGNDMKRGLGFEAAKCNAEPSRVRRLRAELAATRAELDALSERLREVSAQESDA